MAGFYCHVLPERSRFGLNELLGGTMPPTRLGNQWGKKLPETGVFVRATRGPSGAHDPKQRFTRIQTAGKQAPKPETGRMIPDARPASYPKNNATAYQQKNRGRRRQQTTRLPETTEALLLCRLTPELSRAAKRLRLE